TTTPEYLILSLHDALPICPPLPEPVYVDREMWEKVVLNLVSNALKSTFQGEIRVAVSTAGGAARLSVADTGTGIPAADVPHLFRSEEHTSELQSRENLVCR